MNSQTNAPSRNQAIEILRIVSAFGIVAFHSKAPGHEVAYAGLVAFLILSPYVDCAYKWNNPRSISNIAQELLVPWAFWMLVYGLFNIILHKNVFIVDGWLPGVLYGTSQHLWFVPAMFVVLVTLNLIKRCVSPSFLFVASAIGAISLLASSPIWRQASLALQPPLPQWSHAAPAILIGVMLGLADSVPRAVSRVSWAGLTLALCIALGASMPGVGIPYTLGVAAVVATVSINPTRFLITLDIRLLSECMLGVYLSHMIFVRIALKISENGNYIYVTSSFLCAILFVLLTRRFIPLSRWII